MKQSFRHDETELPLQSNRASITIKQSLYHNRTEPLSQSNRVSPASFTDAEERKETKKTRTSV